MHILILGGTSEASALADLLATRTDIRATLSLAGRTRNPVLPAIPYRIGGFGGTEGLAHWLSEQRITAVVDATHPFARIMPFHAARAAQQCHIPILRLQRPAWQPEAADCWTEVTTHEDAMTVLGTQRRQIFLTVGRLELRDYARAPQHRYVVRSIDPVDDPKPLADALWLNARGPFSVENEIALMQEHAIDTVITKNSGGSATQAKLLAARQLGVPVILISRPAKPDIAHVANAQEALEWIARTHALSL